MSGSILGWILGIAKLNGTSITAKYKHLLLHAFSLPSYTYSKVGNQGSVITYLKNCVICDHHVNETGLNEKIICAPMWLWLQVYCAVSNSVTEVYSRTGNKS